MTSNCFDIDGIETLSDGGTINWRTMEETYPGTCSVCSGSTSSEDISICDECGAEIYGEPCTLADHRYQVLGTIETSFYGAISELHSRYFDSLIAIDVALGISTPECPF